MSFTVTGRAKIYLQYVLYVLSFSMIFFQLYITQRFIWSPQMNNIFHLGIAMAILLLSSTIKKGNWLFNAILMIGTIGVTYYFLSAYSELALVTHALPMGAMVSGVLAVILTAIIGYRAFGAIFPVLVIVSLLYITVGQYIPGPLRSPSIGMERIIGWMASDVTTNWGAYGDTLGLSASYLWLFIVFGSFLQAFGAMNFIRRMGELAASRLRSGPAALSVVTSGLLGMVTGSTVANITMSGSFTIPLMKSSGYKPEHAAAIETGASNGGQIMPPVMGVVAFVMASFIGVPYTEIAFKSIIPAALYYIALMLYAQFTARKLGIRQMKTKTNLKSLLLDAPPFVLPLGLLVVLMVSGYSLMFTIFWTILATVAVGLICGYLRKEMRPDWVNIRDILMAGVKSACEVAVTCALVGVAIAAIQLTGLGVTLGITLSDLANNNLFLLLIFTLVVATILGMGLPTVAVYVLTAAVLSPALIRAGVPVLAAHYFPFVYAVFSHLTPPVGIGLIVASKMAGSKYWKSGFEAMKGAFVAYMMPFYLVYAPALLLIFNQGPIIGAIQIASSVVAIIAMSIALNRECFFTLSIPEFAMMWLSTIGISIYIFFMQQAYILLIASVALFAVGMFLNFMTSKKAQAALKPTG